MLTTLDMSTPLWRQRGSRSGRVCSDPLISQKLSILVLLVHIRGDNIPSPSYSKPQVRTIVHSLRPRPVKLNNPAQCEASARPGPAQGFPLLRTARLAALPRPGNKSPWPPTYPTLPHMHTHTNTHLKWPHHHTFLSCLVYPLPVFKPPSLLVVLLLSLHPFSLTQEQPGFNPTPQQHHSACRSTSVWTQTSLRTGFCG